MSLHVYLTFNLRDLSPTTISPDEMLTLHEGNVTHNLVQMAKECKVYDAVWRPEENGIHKAHQLIAILESGITTLAINPEQFKKFNAKNGWGSFENLLQFLQDYLLACQKFPDADVSVWR